MGHAALCRRNASAVVAQHQEGHVVGGPPAGVAQHSGEDRAQHGLRHDGPVTDGLRERREQREEPPLGVPGVLDTVRVQEESVAGQESAAGLGHEGGRERERPERRQRFRSHEWQHTSPAEQIGPGMAAVEGVHLAVAADLQQQDGDELLGCRAVGVEPGRGVIGPVPLAQMPGQRPLESSENTPSSGSSCAASRKLPRTAATVPMAPSP